jgi:hypothetical protein
MTATKKPRRMARPISDAQSVETDSADVPANAGIFTTDKRPTKQNQVLTLLRGEGAVPISAIVEATGWLSHTTRAALTGLRKKGHAIVRMKVDGETRYAITPVASQ